MFVVDLIFEPEWSLLKQWLDTSGPRGSAGAPCPGSRQHRFPSRGLSRAAKLNHCVRSSVLRLQKDSRRDAGSNAAKLQFQVSSQTSGKIFFHHNEERPVFILSEFLGSVFEFFLLTILKKGYPSKISILFFLRCLFCIHCPGKARRPASKVFSVQRTVLPVETLWMDPVSRMSPREPLRPVNQSSLKKKSHQYT